MTRRLLTPLATSDSQLKTSCRRVPETTVLLWPTGPALVEIVRVARRPDALGAFEREACVLGRVGRELDAVVPHPVVTRLVDEPWLCAHEVVQGDVVTREAWSEAVAARDGALARQAANFLRSLHGVAVEKLVDCRLQRRSLSMEATRLRHRGFEVLRDRLSREARTHLRMLLADCSERAPVPECVVHGDFARGHLLVRDGSLGVIDFGDVCLAEPRA